MPRDLIVVGAGVAGLALAREALARGLAPLVLERSRGVGGRCATRRVAGQPVDHGVGFLHGRDRRLLEALATMPDPVVRDWPRVRVGEGVPCQPEAFDVREHRLAPVEGVSRFPKQLAQGLDVRLESEVVRLRAPAAGGAWAIGLANGETLEARAVALALPAPAALALLRRMETVPDEVAGLFPLLELVRMLPSLTVIAGYPAGVPRPDWDVMYPETGRVLHTVLHDSAKREREPALTLVLQARPRFSERRVAEPPEAWAPALLEAAAVLLGEPYARPEAVQAHAWHHARVADGTQLSGPLLADVGGALLGVAGDGLGGAAGLEGAYLSGIALAGRIIGKNQGR
jgi:renalase